MIFDNALTRAQTNLRDALPEDWHIEQFDLVPADWTTFRLEVWYPVSSEYGSALRFRLPMHLIYDTERLAKVVLDRVDRHKQGEFPTVYTFPDVETIVQRLKDANGDDWTHAAAYREFAKRVAGREMGMEVGHDLIFSIAFVDRSLPYRKHTGLLDKRIDLIRAACPDDPLYAEHIVGRIIRTEQTRDVWVQKVKED